MRRRSPSISPPGEKPSETPSRRPQFFASIGAGLHYVWHQPTLRALIIITAVVEFAFAGPFTVGLASLANIKFVGGAMAFGAMLSALGGGLVIGTLIVGATKTNGDFGKAILWLTSAMGVGLILLGLVPNVVWACILIAIIGMIGGYSQVLVATWLQTKSDAHMRGRVMSIVILGANGLTPLSYLLTGVLTHISVSLMFIVIGTFLLITLALCAYGWSRRALDSPQST